MANPPGQNLLVIERILRERDGIWRQINDKRDLRGLTLQMLTSSAVSLAIFGLVLGASNGFWQALSSMVKLPLLFLATLAICLPTLYLFNLVFGARLSMTQAVALVMVSITVIAVLTLGFAPISLFFLITAQNYEFFKLLNVCILALTAVVGLLFLTRGMAALNAYHAAALEAAPAAQVAVKAGGSGAGPRRRRQRPQRPSSCARGDGLPRPYRRAGGSRARRAAHQDGAGICLDPAIRLRWYPARLDAAAVLRRPGLPLRAVPRDQRHVLHRHPANHRQRLRVIA
jgi:hypothetical protein